MDEQALFFRALEIADSEARARWLEGVCSGQPETLHRLCALLESHIEAEEFLERPAYDFVEPLLCNLSQEDATLSLQAGLSRSFREGQAVLIGSAGHSVLRSLSRRLGTTPQVKLRGLEGEEPHELVEPPSPSEAPNREESRYLLQKEIARGGMGAILKGQDTDLGRELAIKVLLEAHKDKPDVVQRFIEEAQIGGQLQHPGIAPVYELGQLADDRPFFSMKLVRGETLAKMLADREDPTSDRLRFLGIFEHVCQTMAYAHSRGVIHRDLKPANIMVGAFGEVQVMDWGLAKVLSKSALPRDRPSPPIDQEAFPSESKEEPVEGGESKAYLDLSPQTELGSVMGTPAYMPPEQARGELEQLDERADVFGLGALLCEILTGAPPYQCETSQDLLRMAACGQIEDCWKRLDHCGADSELISLVRHSLELEPRQRPPHAGIVADRVLRHRESVEAKLRATEIELASEAAHADAETKRFEQQANDTRKLRRILFFLASVALLAAMAGGAAILANQRANALADVARKNEETAKFFASQATAEAQRAKAAELEALDFAGAEAASRALAEEQTQRAEWLVYASNLSLAQTDFLADKGRLAIRYLSDCQESKRGWEHQFLSNLIESRQTLRGHAAEVLSSSFRFDGRRILTSSGDNTARVWDAESGQKKFSLVGHTSRIHAVAYSPDGGRIVTAGGEPYVKGEVYVWDAATGQQFRSVPGLNDSVLNVSISPNGKRLLTTGRGTTRIWNIETAEQEFEVLHDASLATWVAAFSPDGTTFATGGENGIAQIWDAKDGQRLQFFQGHQRGISSLAFSPDGKKIATGSANTENTLRLWTAEDGPPSNSWPLIPVVPKENNR